MSHDHSLVTRRRTQRLLELPRPLAEARGRHLTSHPRVIVPEVRRHVGAVAAGASAGLAVAAVAAVVPEVLLHVLHALHTLHVPHPVHGGGVALHAVEADVELHGGPLLPALTVHPADPLAQVTASASRNHWRGDFFGSKIKFIWAF